MGFFSDLFGGGGPSDGDIERAEIRAEERELARLRLAEQKLRRREAEETKQGSGIATATSVSLGTDTLDEPAPGTVLSLDRAPAQREFGGPTDDDRLPGIDLPLFGGGVLP